MEKPVFGFFHVLFVGCWASAKSLGLHEAIAHAISFSLLFAQCPTKGSVFNACVVLSWLGDIFLLGLINNGIDFLFGMISFMMAHVLFIISFRQAVWRDGHHATPGITLAIMVLVIGAALVVFSKIFPNSGELQMPVLIYMVVIVSMFYHAVRRRGRTTVKSYQRLFAGAFLFLFSDAALGWNKFYAPIPGQTFLIMATYLAAQYLIVEAMIAHPAERPVSEMAHA